jgi:N-acetylglucosamine malate deacetylase 1
MWRRSSFLLGLTLGACGVAAAVQLFPRNGVQWDARMATANALDNALVKQTAAAPPDTRTAPQRSRPAVPPEDGKLRIICFGAHPDDCELKAGGVAARWAAAGHHVKFVSVTNGDIGHWRDAGGPLATRRAAEVAEAARILRISTEVLDIHDGELEPKLENRKQITRLIREWNADIVLGPRPNDYHPDHRYTGVLVQDAAYMVMVPFICPDTPPMKKNPVFLFYSDRFQKPTPFEADVVVNIDEVLNQKLDALDVIVSQFYEGGALGSPELLPDTDEGKAARRREVRAAHAKRFDAEPFRAGLAKWYGADGAKGIGHVEAFEVCEYGRQPSDDELGKLFLIDE